LDALVIEIIKGLPNFAGFVILAWSNNMTINRLFAAIQSSNEADAADRRLEKNE
jgi:hypothetical protein